ncbi:hypothetical protein E2C01_008488 [Portunus trituberculatus]|uniref:Uncharacterized protein n=1 Tax=Portunus trituberculatus TaxID=210409 RepID=A0A5B7D1Y1_PORTR|nr:hypothetical protein [Portunus trituberculatus]
MFKEEFELDLEGNDHEEIHVPDFGLHRQGRFIHDFKVVSGMTVFEGFRGGRRCVRGKDGELGE